MNHEHFGHEAAEAIPHSLELARELEETDDEEVLVGKIGELLSSIERDLGFQFTNNINELYKSMKDEGCLVRTERLSRVLEAIELERTLKISDEDERHYANAVIPEPEGIRIALSEGQAPGPVRMMVGFGKTIIGFKSDNVRVESIDFSQSDIRDSKERAYLCRHVVGELNKDDIKYIVIRMPRQYVREDLLTPDEIKRNSHFIFRGLRLNFDQS